MHVGCVMALPQGINCRATLAYVSDGADEFFMDEGVNNYPTTSTQGNTVGWETAFGNLGQRNRSASNDRRLAGMQYTGTGTKYDLRIDLPSAGSYDIRLAAGDGLYAQPVSVELFDTSSSLGVLSSGSTSAGNKFKDATNVERTAATWPGSNVAVTKTFSTTICRFRLGSGSTLDVMAHAHVAASASAGFFARPYYNRTQAVNRASTY